MITFLAPKLLWALPLAAAPVLLHLLFLRRAARRPFSDLALLRAAYRRAMPSTRLRQWLLLALRVLALASLVAAFARPVLRPGARAAGGAEDGLDAVLLVDSSWSMRAEENGRPRFEGAAASAREFLRLLRPADRAALSAFSAGLDGELRWSADRPAAEAALERMRPGWKGTDLRRALEDAYRFLERERGARGRRRAIVLFSDGARHALRTLPSGGLERLEGWDPEVVVLGLRWGSSPANAAVREVRPATGGERPGFAARLESYGSSGSAGLDLWLRGRRVERREVSLGDGTPRVEEFQADAPLDGSLSGRLELRRDALAADDAWHLALKVEPRPRILYLHGGPDALAAGRGGWFLRELLSEGGRLPFRLDEADGGRLRQLRLEDYAAVVLDDFKEVPPEVAEPLKRHVLRGGGLWVLAGSRAAPSARSSAEGAAREENDLRAENSFGALAPLLPGRLGAAYAPPAAGLRPEEVEDEAPGRGRFRWADFELSGVVLGRRYALEPAADARIRLRDGAGEPLLVEGSFGRGRVLLWASSFDLRWTNLALKPAFAALVETSLARLSAYGGEGRWDAVLVGEPYAREWRAGAQTPARVSVLAPDGRRSTLVVRERRAVYADTREPGLYWMRPEGGEGEAEPFAVNLDRSGGEGDLRADSPPWPLMRLEALREDFLLAVYGREARTLALACALLLLGLELVLTRTGRPS
ncbi:MAG: VWA domain-containing protein [Elusimicrobiota bacterium]|jgi:hypothetical protein